VSAPTVAKYAEALGISKIFRDKVVTRNGKPYTINTANIGKRSEPEPAQADIDTDESRWQAEEWDEPEPAHKDGSILSHPPISMSKTSNNPYYLLTRDGYGLHRCKGSGMT
jgi:hypothetical protein